MINGDTGDFIFNSNFIIDVKTSAYIDALNFHIKQSVIDNADLFVFVRPKENFELEINYAVMPEIKKFEIIGFIPPNIIKQYATLKNNIYKVPISIINRNLHDLIFGLKNMIKN